MDEAGAPPCIETIEVGKLRWVVELAMSRSGPRWREGRLHFRSLARKKTNRTYHPAFDSLGVWITEQPTHVIGRRILREIVATLLVLGFHALHAATMFSSKPSPGPVEQEIARPPGVCRVHRVACQQEAQSSDSGGYGHAITH